jgi:hypothetical protein
MCHAITVLSGSISTHVWHITNRSLVASIQLAHVSSHDQYFLIMGNYANYEVMYGHDGHIDVQAILHSKIVSILHVKLPNSVDNI